MRCWNAVLALFLVRLLLVGGWSVKNIVTSIRALTNSNDRSTPASDHARGNDENSTDGDVKPKSGSIIMAPRRKKICAAGEKVDRRGKCRQVWR
ncbi:hypothetical protein WN51_03359 [Melipona quadrifasciata]|uniref:Secreted protein n=1 Tax=Melipona quadrifasciata TaxID=166423 RepID=A0A0M8ZTP1_9HYME|nr:hypothetical protein WN51_03359 [Melipona quadrifasciata]